MFTTGRRSFAIIDRFPCGTWKEGASERCSDKMRKKINLVDIIVLVAFVAVVAVGILYFTGRDSSPIGGAVSGKVNIVYVAEADNIPEEMLTQLKVGDQLVSAGAFQNGYIKDVQVFKSTDVEAVDGKIVSYELEETRRVVVTIEGVANQYGPYIDLGGQEIKAGSPYYIKTDLFEAYGNVVNIQSKGN